jgi:hypothetical protein
VRVARKNVQAIFYRRRHQERRPPLAKIRPGRPAPTVEAKWKMKWKKKKWKKIPPGWSRGRKVGWGGGRVPPGHRR